MPEHHMSLNTPNNIIVLIRCILKINKISVFKTIFSFITLIKSLLNQFNFTFKKLYKKSRLISIGLNSLFQNLKIFNH